jgi:hypothetical protein
MNIQKVLTLAVTSALIASASASTSVTWFGPSNTPNSNANWPAVNGTYNQNFGVAFKTGPSGTYTMDWATIILNTSTVTAGSASFTLALRNTTNATAYSAVAGTISYATDLVSFTMPATTSTPFTLSLTAANIPNISSYEMAADTAYSLILYAPSVNIGMSRTTGYLSGTTNNNYTVNSGFSALNTFRNNSTYSNNASSFPSLAISFGENTVPEPTSIVLTMLASGVMLIRRKR